MNDASHAVAGESPAVDTKNARSLWRPKRPELPEQCASCPFRKGNAEEFGRIVAKLRAAHGLPPPCKFDTFYARTSIWEEVSEAGDFVCHGTAYNPDMTMRDQREHRQCPGASAHFRARHKGADGVFPGLA